MGKLLWKIFVYFVYVLILALLLRFWVIDRINDASIRGLIEVSSQTYVVLAADSESLNRGEVRGQKRVITNVWEAIDLLIQCESSGKNVEILDTNGLMSRGILQFQDRTWAWMAKEAGIANNTTYKSPLIRLDAIQVARWAIMNGYINHWSCAKILNITYRI